MLTPTPSPSMKGDDRGCPERPADFIFWPLGTLISQPRCPPPRPWHGFHDCPCCGRSATDVCFNDLWDGKAATACGTRCISPHSPIQARSRPRSAGQEAVQHGRADRTRPVIRFPTCSRSPRSSSTADLAGTQMDASCKPHRAGHRKAPVVYKHGPPDLSRRPCAAPRNSHELRCGIRQPSTRCASVGGVA